MIISKTPYRISFFGGGTDYPAWYSKEGGAVLSTTIDKYCYISCRFLPPFFNIKHRIVWSHIETVMTISEILHPAVREGLRVLGFDDSTGLEIHHQGDLPARSGIGSSSSFTVGLIHVLTALKGQSLNKQDLALKAIELEQDVLKETVGSQDQIAAAYGGFNLIQFFKNSEFQVDPVSVLPSRLEALESSLMLIYTGTSRISSEIATGFISKLRAKAPILRRMRAMVDEAVSILGGTGDLDAFGELLHEGWMLKRNLGATVTNPVIDQVYDTARSGGALGGKLLGAGSSGFLVFYVRPDRQESVKRALSHYLSVPFSFESKGTTLIHNGSAADGDPSTDLTTLSKERRPGGKIVTRLGV